MIKTLKRSEYMHILGSDDILSIAYMGDIENITPEIKSQIDACFKKPGCLYVDE